MHEIVSTFVSLNLFYFESIFSSNITPKEPELSPIAKFHKLFKGAQSRLNGLKSLAKLFKFRCL